MKSNTQFIGMTKRAHSVGNFVFDSRIARALSEGVSRYPILRRAALALGDNRKRPLAEVYKALR
jgi:hypothetical protein